jgi:hypothetical protein
MLSACVTNDLTPPPTASQPGELPTDNKGVVVIYTSYHADRCQVIRVNLARPNEANRYSSVESYNINSSPIPIYLDHSTMPAQIALPEGRYGIVGLECNKPYRNQRAYANVSEKKDYLWGSTDIYDRPIATFDVQPGEVVDIGMLTIKTYHRTNVRLFAPAAAFTASVTPIPGPVLQNFATNKPELAAKAVTRLMVILDKR